VRILLGGLTSPAAFIQHVERIILPGWGSQAILTRQRAAGTPLDDEGSVSGMFRWLLREGNPLSFGRRAGPARAKADMKGQ
jgi:hypothetical protein